MAMLVITRPGNQVKFQPLRQFFPGRFPATARLLFALISRVVLPRTFGETIATIGVATLLDDLRNGGLAPGGSLELTVFFFCGKSSFFKGHFP